MRRLRVLTLFLMMWLPLLAADHYTLKIYGLTIGTVTMDAPTKQEFNFSTQSSGLIDLILPFNNTYYTKFDTLDYTILEYKKKISQGNFEQKLKGSWSPDENQFIYQKPKGKIPFKSKSIFSLFKFIRQASPDEIDGQWMNLEMEGNLYKVRYLLAGSDTLSLGEDEIDCHHYRMDLYHQEELISLLDKTDYFLNNIVKPESVRQLWVEKGREHRIIKTSVTLSGITIEAVLDND